MRLTTRRLTTLVLFLGLFSLALRVAVDANSFGHLAWGRWMLDHRQILDVDVFSHTRSGQPWMNPSWLSDVMMAIVFRGLGYPGLNLMTALVACIAFGVVHRSSSGDAYLRAVVVALAAATCAFQMAAGPQVVSLLMTAIFGAVLLQHRTRGAHRLWLLPVATVAWANLSDGFVVGIALVATTCAGEAMQWVASRRGLDVDGVPGDEPSHAVRIFAPSSARDSRGERVRWLGVTGVACVLAAGCNPHGWRVFEPTVHALSNLLLHPVSPAMSTVTVPAPSAAAFLGMWVATLVALATSRRRLNVTDVLLFAVFSVVTLRSASHVAAFAIVLAPILARHAEGIVEAARRRRVLLDPATAGASGRLGALAVEPASPWAASAFHVAVLGAVVAGVAFKASLPLDPALVDRLIATESPVGAADYLRRHPHPGALFNARRFGGYLAWALPPETPVYVDGRNDLYGDAFLSRYTQAYGAHSGWRRTLAEDAVGTVVVDPQAPIAQALLRDPDWSLRYRDPVAVVLERNP